MTRRRLGVTRTLCRRETSIRIQNRSFPFKHAACEHVLPQSVIPEIVAYSQSGACWVEQKSDIYHFSSLGSRGLALKTFVNILSATALKLLHVFHDSYVTYDVFKFTDGQGIGVHDDSDIDVYRLAITISGTRTLTEGGSFILIGKQASDVIVYPASQNSGVLFRTRPGHRHAVSVVKGHTLLLLVLQFERRPATMIVEDAGMI